MGRLINSIFNNDSVFGQIMTRLGIIIGANLMFLLFSLPMITIGPAIAALYHVMLRVLRSDGVLNPFKEFWIGFRNNLKQGILYWIAVLLITVAGILDIRFCNYAGGILIPFKYLNYTILAAVVAVTAYLFPVMAAFADTIPHLIRNAVFFIARNPFKMLLIVFLNVFPLVVTYLDQRLQPLYAFLWTVCGFGGIAMLNASFLVKDFSRFLPEVDALGNPVTEEEENPIPAGQRKTERKILEDMKKLGM